MYNVFWKSERYLQRSESCRILFSIDNTNIRLKIYRFYYAYRRNKGCIFMFMDIILDITMLCGTLRVIFTNLLGLLGSRYLVLSQFIYDLLFVNRFG